MARRGMTGQLNMFDFFRELETNIPQDGELEMVSLMPSFEEDEIPVSSGEVKPVTEVVKVVEEKKAEEKRAEEKKIEISLEVVTEHKSKQTTENKKKNNTENNTKPEIIQKPEQRPVSSLNTDKRNDSPVMQRTYTTKQGIVEIAYMNYSKVRVSLPGEETQIMEFASSKEAVDYYVEQMQKLEELYTTDN